MNVRLWKRRKRSSRSLSPSLKNRCVPVMVLGAKRGAGRVIAGRVIIGEARVAVDEKDRKGNAVVTVADRRACCPARRDHRSPPEGQPERHCCPNRKIILPMAN